jgi:hypothetical protein
MARYDRQYDFGLRGYRQTTRPMMDNRYRPRSYDSGFRGGFDERSFPEQRLSNRVTARYNRDYVTGYSSDRYDRNQYMYGGDHPDRMGDGNYMRRPYYTQAGTRTMRGTLPSGNDYPSYGPTYGGRFPDEL